jgi:hypothetical protein
MTTQAPREFWIKNALAYETQTDGASYHVIEKSAYDQAKAEAQAWREIVKKIRAKAIDARDDKVDAHWLVGYILGITDSKKERGE